MIRFRFLYLIPLLMIITWLSSCKPAPTPKPKGYFRINLPQKEYKSFSSTCPFEFEYPAYGIVEELDEEKFEPCWYNISFPKFKAKIHLTYKDVDNNLADYIEDVRLLVYKHVVKADDIVEDVVLMPESNVYGIIYKLSGNTAASATFFLTDSTQHFLTGSLYFSAKPNKDSLAPLIQFFDQDIVHLSRTINWK